MFIIALTVATEKINYHEMTCITSQKLCLENGNYIVNATAYLWTRLRENTNNFYLVHITPYECRYVRYAKWDGILRLSINYENYQIVLTIVFLIYLLLRMSLLWWCHCWMQTKEACQYIILPATDCCIIQFFVRYGYLFFLLVQFCLS